MSWFHNRRRRFFANRMHKDLFFIVVNAAVWPTLITAVFLYYLIFYITTEQIGIPEAVAANVIPAAKRVSGILWVLVPIIICAILFIAFKMTHRIMGPFDRIVRELDELIAGSKTTPIKIRDDDKFCPMVDRINTLLQKRTVIK